MAAFEVNPNKPLILVAGAGFGGLISGIQIRNTLKYDNFLIFEKKMEVGGTWRENTYPGCGCDVPSHWYSISTDPNPNWSKSYSAQPEIQEYLKDVATRNQLRSHIRFGHQIISAVWDSANSYYNVEYQILTPDNDKVKGSIKAHVLISAMGGLHIPKMPDFKGIETFKGELMHTARWRSEVDLRGKNVAVIGNGCSSCQVVPAISEDPSVNVTNFCRTPAWFAPRPQVNFSPLLKFIFRYVPFAHKFYRFLLYLEGDLSFVAWITKLTLVRKLVEAFMAWRMRVKTPKHLHKQIIPKYPFGCKRIVRDPGYLASLHRPNVKLEWDAITEVVPEGIITKNGTLHKTDVLVAGTGFETADIAPPIFGINRQSVGDYFVAQKGPTAYRGTTIPGFPNVFMILGPNVASGHASAVFVEECQVNYAMKMIKPIIQQKLKAVEVKAKATDDYNDWLQSNMKGTVWTGCLSWYNLQGGKNVAMFPHFATYFWAMMISPKWRDYILTKA